MKFTWKHITDQLFSFSKDKKNEPAAKSAPSFDPPKLDGTIFASNVLGAPRQLFRGCRP